MPRAKLLLKAPQLTFASVRMIDAALSNAGDAVVLVKYSSDWEVLVGRPGAGAGAHP
jgi:hypothetical protein